MAAMWTPCEPYRVRSEHGRPATLPAVTLRRLRKGLETLTANGCINGWARCHPLWEDETRTVVRLQFPDDQSAAYFALVLDQLINVPW